MTRSASPAMVSNNAVLRLKAGFSTRTIPSSAPGACFFDGSAPYNGVGALPLIATPSCLPHGVGCSEPAEVWERPEVPVPFRSAVWYGFAWRLNDPHAQDDRRYVIAQWKRETLPEAVGDYSPFLALRLYRSRLGIIVETDLIPSYPIGGSERPKGCLPGEALVLSRTEAQQTRALAAIESGATSANYPSYFNACAPGIRVTPHADLPSAQQDRIDFVVRSQPGPDGEGHIEIIAAGVPIVTVKGHIRPWPWRPGARRQPVFQVGPDRAPAPLPWSISYDDFRRDPRCSDVIRIGQCPPEPQASKAIGKLPLSTSSDVRKGEER